ESTPAWPSGACQGILVEDVWMRDHYRQGMSVTSVQGLTVRHCWFTGTSGTLPESGVDIEPYLTYQPVQDILFEHCLFTGNGHCGIQVSLWELDAGSPPVDITFRDCRTHDNGRPGHPYGPKEIDVHAGTSLVQGQVTFERVHVDGSDWSAVTVVKPAAAFATAFTQCAFTDVSRAQVPFNAPLWVETPSYSPPQPAFGGVAFSNCLVTYGSAYPFLWIYGFNGSQGVAEVSFQGTVENPGGGGVQITAAPDTIACSFNAVGLAALPATTVTWAMSQPVGQECGPMPITLEAVRQGLDLSFPLPTKYDADGDVSYGDDVHRLPGSLVIAANVNDASLSIVPRADGIAEAPEEVVVTALSAPWYALSAPGALAGTVYDCFGTAVQGSPGQASYAIAPNPASASFRMDGLDPQMPLVLLDASGREVRTGTAGLVDVHGLPPGLYRVRMRDGGHEPAWSVVVIP
ncbi:MAG: hypothetical protein ACK4L7_10050, partial [Flavobacteriales bacterium]